MPRLYGLVVDVFFIFAKRKKIYKFVVVDAAILSSLFTNEIFIFWCARCACNVFVVAVLFVLFGSAQ